MKNPASPDIVKFPETAKVNYKPLDIVADMRYYSGIIKYGDMIEMQDLFWTKDTQLAAALMTLGYKIEMISHKDSILHYGLSPKEEVMRASNDYYFDSVEVNARVVFENYKLLLGKVKEAKNGGSTS